MTPIERRKAIDNAVAVAATNPLVPIAVRVGLAAMAEELRELRDLAQAQLDAGASVRRIDESETPPPCQNRKSS